MTTITVNVYDAKAEKAIRSVIEALGLEYDIEGQEEDKALFTAMEEGKQYGRLSKEEKDLFIRTLKDTSGELRD